MIQASNSGFSEVINKSKAVVSPADVEKLLLEQVFKPIFDDQAIPEGVKKIVQAYIHELATKFTSLAYVIPEVDKKDGVTVVTNSEVPTFSFERMYREIYRRKLQKRYDEIIDREVKKGTFPLKVSPLDAHKVFEGIEDLDAVSRALEALDYEKSAKEFNTNGLMMPTDTGRSVRTNPLLQEETLILDTIRDEAINEAIDAYSEFVRAVVATNHPTDLFTTEAKLAFYQCQTKMWNLLQDLWKTGKMEEQSWRTPLVDTEIVLNVAAEDEQANFEMVKRQRPKQNYNPFDESDRVTDIRKNFLDLVSKLKAPNRNLTLQEEATYNSRMSSASYDAVWQLTRQMLDQVKAMGGDPDKFIDRATERSIMIVKDWMRDGDGKPNKRPEDTIFGAFIKKCDINYRYISELANFAVKINKDNKLGQAEKDEAIWRLKAMIWKRLDMIEDAYIDRHGADKVKRARIAYKNRTWNYITKTLREYGIDEEAVGLLKEVFVDRGFTGKEGVSDPVKPDEKLKTNHSIWSQNFGYIRFVSLELKKSQDILMELELLREKSLTDGPQKYGDDFLSTKELDYNIKVWRRDVESKKAVVSDLRVGAEDSNHVDVSRFNEELLTRGNGKYANYHKYGVNLGVQGHTSKENFKDEIEEVIKLTDDPDLKIFKQIVDTFGDYSRVGEFRQAADVYEHSFDLVSDRIHENGIVKELSALGMVPQGPNNRYTIAQLLEIMDDEKYQDVAEKIRNIISVWITNNEKSASDAFQSFKEGNTENAWLFRIHDLLNELSLTFEYPGATNMHLIAECNGPDTILKALFLTLVMSRGEKEELFPRIAALIEYSKDIFESPDTIRTILSNKVFQKYAKKASEQHDSGWRMEKFDEAAQEWKKVTLDGHLKSLYKQYEETGNEKILETYDLAMKNLRERAIEEGTTLEKLLEQNIFDIHLMVAGSDANKSSSTAIWLFTDVFAYDQSRAEAVVFGAFVQEYLGCGTAMHRNHIINNLHLTNQGLGVREFSLVQARESEHSLTIAAARQQGFGTMQIGDAKTPKLILALHNFGNHLGLPDRSQNYVDYEGAGRTRIGNYTRSYGDNEGTLHYREGKDLNRLRASTTVLSSLIKDYEFSARPTTRIGERKHPDGLNADPQTDRTIGWDDYMIKLGFMPPHMYVGLSEFLGANSLGDFNDASLDKACENYLSSSYCQDQVNRGIWAITRSDPDVAWKHIALSMGFTEDKIKRKIDDKGAAVILIDGQEIPAVFLAEAQDYSKLRSILPLSIRSEIDKLEAQFIEKSSNFDQPARDDLVEITSRILAKKFNIHEDAEMNKKELNKALDEELVKAGIVTAENLTSPSYKEIRKALIAYVSKRENTLGALRSAANLDIELTSATKAINTMLVKTSGYQSDNPLSLKELANKDTTMKLLNHISPVLHDEYAGDISMLKWGREEILEQVKEQTKSPVKFTKPIKEDSEAYPTYNKYWMAHSLIRTMIGEKPVQFGKNPELAIAASMKKGVPYYDSTKHTHRAAAGVGSRASSANLN